MRAGRKGEAICDPAQGAAGGPDNVDAMRALAGIYWRDEENLGDAEALLRRATALAPGYRRRMDDARHAAARSRHGTRRRSNASGPSSPSSRITPSRGRARQRPCADRRHGEERSKAYARSPRAEPEGARPSHGLRPRAEGARRPGRSAARVSRRDRAEAGLRRSVLEHGESQGLPLRGRRSRGDGAAAASATT